jgi:UDP:flavonoid glycosyltransferase YjiC (YdhE family)
MRFASKPLSISEVAKSADAACLHSGHSTTAAMLLGGVPMLLFPEVIEQLIVARNVAALGAGLVIPPHVLRSGLDRPLAQLLRANARTALPFAKKYSGFDAKNNLVEMVLRIHTLAGQRFSSSVPSIGLKAINQ